MKNRRLRRVCRTAFLLLVSGLLFQGCASSLERKRLAQYRPDDDDRRPWVWGSGADQREDAGGTDEDHDDEAANEARFARTIERGSRVSIYLRGIPTPEEVKEVVDELGSVSLPLVGLIDIAGLTTAEAERKVRNEYVARGFYKDINVIVVAEEDEYFVRGEVKREGRYPLSGDLTLMQAITTAGGFTEYARTSRIKIIRKGKEPEFYHWGRIEDRREPDPPIEPGDIIVVPRSIVWG